MTPDQTARIAGTVAAVIGQLAHAAPALLASARPALVAAADALHRALGRPDQGETQARLDAIEARLDALETAAD